MDELTRFAQRLVERLGASGEGVHRPVSIGSLRETILPYRTNRAALGLGSVEDYETVLLRLVAEEGGYVKTVPAAAAERCREVLTEINPDLGVLDEVADSTIQVTSIAAARIVADEGGAPVIVSSLPAPVIPSETKGTPAMSNGCAHCSKPIPADREVVFCPWCGKRLIPHTCARCGTELNSDWLHCITCGAPSKDLYRFP